MFHNDFHLVPRFPFTVSTITLNNTCNIANRDVNNDNTITYHNTGTHKHITFKKKKKLSTKSEFSSTSNIANMAVGGVLKVQVLFLDDFKSDPFSLKN